LSERKRTHTHTHAHTHTQMYACAASTAANFNSSAAERHLNTPSGVPSPPTSHTVPPLRDTHTHTHTHLLFAQIVGFAPPLPSCLWALASTELLGCVHLCVCVFVWVCLFVCVCVCVFVCVDNARISAICNVKCYQDSINNLSLK